MWLHHDTIASSQTGKESGIGIPGGKGTTTDYQADAARHYSVPFFHFERLVFALWFFPVRSFWNALHFRPGVCDRLQTAILGVGAASLKCHHESLSGGVHDGVGDLETTTIYTVQDLQRGTDPHFRFRRSPISGCRVDAREERIQIDLWIVDLQRKTIR